MKPSAFLTIGLGLAVRSSGHMLVSYPPALRWEGNPNVPTTEIDYDLTSPLNSNFPCKGYQNDLGSDLGAAVATWEASGSYNFTLLGSATHNGGSCQASLSYDKGQSFTVIHSYIGDCPVNSPPGGSFPFTVPSDAPAGAALFAWTWFNNVGNREMYMNCASVMITSGPAKAELTTNVPFSERPSILVANVQNGCTTIAGTDVVFPNPGSDVTDVSTRPGGIVGICQAPQ